MQYTLSNGLNIVANTASSGTTGLIGLTGKVVGDTVQLYATNATIGDLDQTYLYGITDSLSSTTGTGESFTTLATAAPDTNIRGVAFAPTDAAACYCSGTAILTTHGSIAIEALRVGDLVVTASGARRPIRWIGHRIVDCRTYPEPGVVWPVRIAADAFGSGKPARDLYVSPGHAICVDVIGEVLIPRLFVDQRRDDHADRMRADDLLARRTRKPRHPARRRPARGELSRYRQSRFLRRERNRVAQGASGRTGGHRRELLPPIRHGWASLRCRDRSPARARARQLGWTLETSDLADLHLVVDGIILAAATADLAVRFVVPADAKDVWLVSRTSVPAHISSSSDHRALGVDVRALTIDDGFGAPRAVSLDDSLLCVGFHPLEDGTHRWTAGRARLPATLWAGCRESFFLRVDLAAPALARWIAPETVPVDHVGVSRMVLDGVLAGVFAGVVAA